MPPGDVPICAVTRCSIIISDEIKSDALSNDGLDYARRLGSFRLRFTAMLPALLGIKTLRLIAQRAGVERVKISRLAVYVSLLNAAWLSVWRRAS